MLLSLLAAPDGTRKKGEKKTHHQRMTLLYCIFGGTKMFSVGLLAAGGARRLTGCDVMLSTILLLLQRVQLGSELSYVISLRAYCTFLSHLVQRLSIFKKVQGFNHQRHRGWRAMYIVRSIGNSSYRRVARTRQALFSSLPPRYYSRSPYKPYPFWSMPKICHSNECVRLGRFNK